MSLSILLNAFGELDTNGLLVAGAISTIVFCVILGATISTANQTAKRNRLLEAQNSLLSEIAKRLGVDDAKVSEIVKKTEKN